MLVVLAAAFFVAVALPAVAQTDGAGHLWSTIPNLDAAGTAADAPAHLLNGTTDIRSIAAGLDQVHGVTPAVERPVDPLCLSNTSLLYNYTSISVQSPVSFSAADYDPANNSNFTLSVTVLLSCIPLDDSTVDFHVFDIRLAGLDVLIDGEPTDADSDLDLSLPFRLARAPTGQVVGVIYDAAELSTTLSLKKAIAEVFNTNFHYNNGTNAVQESGVTADRVSDYSAVVTNGTLVVSATYNQSSILSWSSGATVDSSTQYVVESRAAFELSTGLLLESYDRTSVAPDSSGVSSSIVGPVIAHALSSDAVLIGKAPYQPNSTPLPDDIAAAIVPLSNATASEAATLRRRSPAAAAAAAAEAESLVDSLATSHLHQPDLAARLVALARRDPAAVVPSLLGAAAADAHLARRAAAPVPVPGALYSALVASGSSDAHLALLSLVRDDPRSARADTIRTALVFAPSASAEVAAAAASLASKDPRLVLPLGSLLSHRPADEAAAAMTPILLSAVGTPTSLPTFVETKAVPAIDEEAAARAILAVGNMGQNAAPLAPLLASFASDAERSARIRLAAVASLRSALTAARTSARDAFASVLAGTADAVDSSDLRVRLAVLSALSAAAATDAPLTALSIADALDAEMAFVLLSAASTPDERGQAAIYCQTRFGPRAAYIGGPDGILALAQSAASGSSSDGDDDEGLLLHRRSSVKVLDVTLLYYSTQWTSSETSAYNLVEDLATRQADAAAYVNQSALLAGNKIGWDTLNIQAAAGAFGGAFSTAGEDSCPLTPPAFKAFAHARILGVAWSNSLDFLDAEIYAVHDTDGNAADDADPIAALSVVFMGRTLVADSLPNKCLLLTDVVVPEITLTALTLTYSIPVYVATVTLTLTLDATYSATADLQVCPAPSASLALVHDLDLTLTGSATVSLVLASGTLAATGNIDVLLRPDARVLAPDDPPCALCADIEIGHGAPSVNFTLALNALGIGGKFNLYSWTGKAADYQAIPGAGGCLEITAGGAVVIGDNIGDSVTLTLPSSSSSSSAAHYGSSTSSSVSSSTAAVYASSTQVTSASSSSSSSSSSASEAASASSTSSAAYAGSSLVSSSSAAGSKQASTVSSSSSSAADYYGASLSSSSFSSTSSASSASSAYSAASESTVSSSSSVSLPSTYYYYSSATSLPGSSSSAVADVSGSASSAAYEATAASSVIYAGSASPASSTSAAATATSTSSAAAPADYSAAGSSTSAATTASAAAATTSTDTNDDIAYGAAAAAAYAQTASATTTTTYAPKTTASSAGAAAASGSRSVTNILVYSGAAASAPPVAAGYTVAAAAAAAGVVWLLAARV